MCGNAHPTAYSATRESRTAYTIFAQFCVDSVYSLIVLGDSKAGVPRKLPPARKPKIRLITGHKFREFQTFLRGEEAGGGNA